jgi:hypothetical protein
MAFLAKAATAFTAFKTKQKAQCTHQMMHATA